MFFNPARSGRAGFERWPYPRWIARCDAGDPLAAIRAGFEQGLRMFALEVGIDAAGEPQLNGATLAEVASLCKALGVSASLRLVSEPGREKEAGRVVAQAAVRLWRPDFGSGVRVTPPLLISNSPDALTAARGYATQLRRCLLLERWEPDWLPALQQLDCTALACDARLWTPGLVRVARTRHLRALACAVDDEDTARRLLEWKVDCLVTDRPELAATLPEAQAEAADDAAAPSPGSR